MGHIGTKHNGISILASYKNTLTKQYASFSGRANRDVYCAFLVVYYILSLFGAIPLGFSLGKLLAEHQEAILAGDIAAIAQVPSTIALGFVYTALIQLLHFIPRLALLVRRAHDVNISGWWMFLAFILLNSPLLSHILLGVLALLPGTPGPNQYGRLSAKKDEITLTNYLLVGLLCIQMAMAPL